MRFTRWLVPVLLVVSAGAQARAQIQVSVEPRVSRSGEPVRFKIRIESDQGTIGAPEMPKLQDWEVTGSYESRSGGATIVNGKFTRTMRAEFTYILKPLRKGNLAVPAVRVPIGNEVRLTASTSVPVENLPGGAAQRPRVQLPMPQPGLPTANDPFGNQPSQPSQPQIPTASLEEPLPEGQTFFLRSEPDKLSAYVGELITISYALYQRQLLRLEDPAFAKFPDFKGFLKEELEMPRKFVPIPVQLLGETLYRSEMMKYAVFPLKPGNLIIQPMVFKATVFPSQADILNSIMNGSMPQAMGDGIPMEKSSKELRLTIKPLPTAPTGTPFSGAVGQFELELKGPVGKLTVDQPFTVTLTIAGKGNVKSIEEPIFDLPKGLEPYQTKNQYEFRPDATGYKSFEYLLLPRQGGKMQIPALTWGYFDPETEQFRTLKTEPIELNIEGTANPALAERNNEADKKAPVEAFAAWQAGGQDFIGVGSIGSPAIWSGPIGWVTQLVAYAGALVLFVRRRRQRGLDSYYANSPWAKTEREILARTEWDNKELAILIDQWTRERLWNLLDDPELNTESARDEFAHSLRTKLGPDQLRHLTALQDVWTELDILRFTGAKSQRTQARPYLERAKKAVEPFVKALDRKGPASITS